MLPGTKALMNGGIPGGREGRGEDLTPQLPHFHLMLWGLALFKLS